MVEADSAADPSETLALGPGQLFSHFLAMEEVLDKLKVLNYDKEFVKELKQKPLTAWLVRKAGKTFEQPQEYDDPNSTISSVLEHAREFGAVVDFPPNRLKQGYGEHVVYIINCLVDNALKTKDTSKWAKAEPKEDVLQAVVKEEDESELLLEKVEEELAGLSENDEADDEEENVLNLDDLRNIQLHRTLLQQKRPDDVLQSTVRSEEWQVEIERVLPQLRVTVHADARDWRAHLEQMHKYRSSLEDNLTSTKSQLEKVQNDIDSSLEKIENREKHLNLQLEPLLLEFRAKQEELNEVQKQYKVVNSGVSERSKILSKLTEDLETVKKQMDARSSSMTDGSPLINGKKAINRLKAEIKEMDVRLGVLNCEILQSKLRHKAMDHLEATEAIY